MVVQPIRARQRDLPARAGIASGQPGVVLPFRRGAAPANCFSVRDRIELMRWSDTAGAYGLSRVVLEHAEPEDDRDVVGDFALMYDDASEWATWAVAREAGGYMLWSPNTGHTIGHFATLSDALAAILAPGC